ncbi:MAG: hypothetical protein ACE5D0_03285 [Fidelibacterota bacterium]
MTAIKKVQIIIIILIILPVSVVLSRSINFTGQSSITGFNNPLYSQPSFEYRLQYIPTISLENQYNNSGLFDAEWAIDFNYTSHFDSLSMTNYRSWIRFKSNDVEIRAGIQKLNFGPAKLFRPLQWFDTLNPIDPLQLTPGINAVRFRKEMTQTSYYMMWIIHKTDEMISLEPHQSKNRSNEFGGRYQTLTKYGEIGVTSHFRFIEPGVEKLPEFRLALDGSFDMGINSWFESVFIKSKEESGFIDFQQITTIGVDYTFDLGNGFYSSLEAYRYYSSGQNISSSTTEKLGALFSYPLSIFDNFTSISYYDLELKKSFQYLSWQRAYDNLTLNAGLFLYQSTAGYQIILTYYH